MSAPKRSGRRDPRPCPPPTKLPAERPFRRPASPGAGSLGTHSAAAPSRHSFAHLSAASVAPVQRYIAIKDDYNKVFVPKSDKPDDSGEQAIFETSLKTLVPGVTAVDYRNWKGFGLKVMAAGSGYEQESDIPEYLHSEVGGKKSEFEERMKVFEYASKSFLKSYEPAKVRLLLSPKDMKEAGDDLGSYTQSEACVIQSLGSLGMSVKDVDVFSGTSSEAKPTEATSFHKYAKSAGIDYRTDSQYIKIYTSLGFTLISNTPTTWDKIDWKANGNGKYAVSSFPTGYSSSAVGHMIAVIVSDGGDTLDIRDVQNLTRPKLVGGSADPSAVGVSYIFKK